MEHQRGHAYGQFSKFQICFCGPDSGNLKFEKYGQVLASGTVSFHNFKSQNLKLSVSNPESRYVACLSVLSRISNCQGLGRKNEHDILKAYRTIL